MLQPAAPNRNRRTRSALTGFLLFTPAFLRANSSGGAQRLVGDGLRFRSYAAWLMDRLLSRRLAAHSMKTESVFGALNFFIKAHSMKARSAFQKAAGRLQFLKAADQLPAAPVRTGEHEHTFHSSPARCIARGPRFARIVS